MLDMQISSLVDVLDWQKRSDDARLKDQQALHDRLDKLETQLKELLSMSFLCALCNITLTLLGAQRYSPEALMVSFERYIEERSGGDRVLEFFSRCIRYLSVMSGRPIQREPSWMITSFDIDFVREIGSGGL